MVRLILYFIGFIVFLLTYIKRKKNGEGAAVTFFFMLACLSGIGGFYD